MNYVKLILHSFIFLFIYSTLKEKLSKQKTKASMTGITTVSLSESEASMSTGYC